MKRMNEETTGTMMEEAKKRKRDSGLDLLMSK